MTIEFWPRRLLKPRSRAKRRRRKPKPQRPKLPIPAGKAQQKLSQAILCGDHALASWIDGAAKAGLVTGSLRAVREFRNRLDTVMEPLSG